MSITDELRKYTDSQIKWLDITKVHYRNLLSIADRIDEEHESKVGCTADEWDYWESTHIELPKDAHDECIYVGDVLDGYGKTIEVVELRIGRSGWVIVSRDGNAYADTSAFAHHKPPTVEDVLWEFLRDFDEWRGYSGPISEAPSSPIDKYIERLQLKEGE